MLRKLNHIFSAVNAHVCRTTHKYGIEVPTSVGHSKWIDVSNDNLFWKDDIDKEITTVAAAFEIIDEDKPSPVGWKKTSWHLVFDINMDFTHKDRWVKDSHRTADPEQSTSAVFVSQQSVRIAFTYAPLNVLYITEDDMKNAYLQSLSSETHYIICGDEFGLEKIGKVALIRRAIYGSKSSGADFWKHLWSCIMHPGFTSCKADPYIWMREVHKYDGTPVWEYVLLYVDDALVISNRGEYVIRK